MTRADHSRMVAQKLSAMAARSQARSHVADDAAAKRAEMLRNAAALHMEAANRLAASR